jgi:hypothetical protein
MGILKGIFTKGSGIDPQKTFDTVASGVDKLFFTNQEKSEAAQKAWDQWLEWYKLSSSENSARSYTRRILAVIFSTTFLFMLLAAAGAWLVDPDYATFLFNVAKELFPMVSGILFFYFGYYAVNSMIKMSKNKGN